MQKKTMWWPLPAWSLAFGCATQATAGLCMCQTGISATPDRCWDPLVNLAPSTPARGSAERLVLDAGRQYRSRGNRTVWFFR